MNKLLRSFAAFARVKGGKGGKGISGKAYIVGGTVRDIVLGEKIKDFDIALDGDALAVAKNFASHIKGSYVLMDETYETARVVKFFSLDISRMRGTSIEDDLAERDITINAMALGLSPRPSSSKIIDPFKGLSDLRNRKIRMVSEDNLRKDPLRLLRVYRFSASLGFSIEKETASALKRLAPLIKLSASERIMDELRHIMSLDNSYPTIRAMKKDGMLFHLLPELKREGFSLITLRRLEAVLNNLCQYFPYEDIQEHLKDNYRIICMKFIALVHGLRHSEVRDIAERLRMSNKEGDFIFKMLINLKKLMFLSEKHPKKTTFVRLLKELKDDIFPVLITFLAVSKNKKRLIAFSNGVLDFYLREVRPRLGVRFITGDDLIGEFHLEPSPLFKQILSRVEDLTLSGKITSKEDAFRAVRNTLKKYSQEGNPNETA